MGTNLMTTDLTATDRSEIIELIHRYVLVTDELDFPGGATCFAPEGVFEGAYETFRARARTAEEPERTRLFDQQAKEMPFFDGYRKRVKAREIPVVVFERLASKT